MESMKHDRTINLRLTAEQHAALSEEAQKEQRPVGQYIRYLLVRHLDAGSTAQIEQASDDSAAA